jgi:hypothetical protein
MRYNQFQTSSSRLIPKQRSWLYVLLIITLLATLWSLFDNDNISSDDTLLLKPSTSVVGKSRTKNQLKQPKDKIIHYSGPKIISRISNDVSPTAELVSRKYVPISQNFFSIQTWNPPLSKAKDKLRLPPPPQLAPTIPYTYIGKIEEEGEAEYFVLLQNKLITVKIGQTLNGQWRLNGEDEQYLSWTYVPLGLTQTLVKPKNK